MKTEQKIPNEIELYAVKPKISWVRYIWFWTDFSPWRVCPFLIICIASIPASIVDSVWLSDRAKRRWRTRTAVNRPKSSSFNIVDAQSVKNADTAEQTGYDGGKKVSGIKRHISVDILGLPHAIHVTTANVTDRKGAIKMYEQYPELKETIEAIFTDGGYTGEKFQKEIQKLLNANVQVAKRSELHQFQVIPKRWIVERSFAWLEKYRRLFKNIERKLDTSKQMVVLGFLAILIKR